jgi:hypothetical protein
VAEGLDAPSVGDGDEPPQAAPGNILEEDALDGIALTELEDSLEGGPVDDSGHV